MRTRLNIFLAFVVLALMPINNLSAQITTSAKVKKAGNNSFNFPDEAKNINNKLKKDASIKVVFSDRDNNPVYADPYAQQRIGTQPMGAAFFVVNSKNDAFQVVEADFSLLGKPKTFFSFLMSAKYHFKDARNAPYVGWIPKTRLLEFDHSFLYYQNNKPLKYRIGINNMDRLFNIHRYFVNDTLNVFKDPFLKEKTGKYVLLNQIVYPYKYDETGKAVLVSTQPMLRNSASQVVGWIPADLISLAGQNQVTRVSGETKTSLVDNSELVFDGNDLYQNTLFYRTGNAGKFSQNRDVSIVAPLNVWNHERNKLINVKGDDILISEVHRFEKECRNVNLHLIFFENDKYKVTKTLNALQNIWMQLSELSDYSYTFSATCISDKGNYYLPSTSAFDEWLDYVEQITAQGVKKGEHARTYDFDGAITDIIKNSNSKNFENNIFMVLGTNQKLELKPYTINKFGQKSGKFLFVQINNQSSKNYQDFILQAKELLSETGMAYIDFIQKYIVENSLLKGGNFINLSSLSAVNDNIYVFDAPETSLANGGLVFPVSNNYLSNEALSIAIDSLIIKSNKTSEQLLSSLRKHERKLGTLRSEPSPVLTQLFNSNAIADSMSITSIDKNSVNDVFYKEMLIDNSLCESQEQGCLVNMEEMKELLQNYHDLLPYFAGIVTRKECKVLKRMYKEQINAINRIYKRKVLSGGSTMSDLFFRKTGMPVYDNRFERININRLTSKAVSNAGFDAFYKELTTKLDKLEEMFEKNQLEIVTTPQGNCFFIPKHLML